MESAEILINNKKFVEGLFFCHLVIEKILKALVVKNTKNLPPKSHNLEYLSRLANVDLSEEQKDFMAILMKYQLEGRYPEDYPQAPDNTTTLNYLTETNELLLCLKKML
jgi:HEPN domain-containing protein